jgi:SAM-dependent methyltransferase
MTYQNFAYIYDDLMKDVPYDAWINFFQRNIQGNRNKGKVLDVACGTGTLSIPLAKMGFNVTGLDLSSEMLSVADEKARREQVSLTLLEQNMTELSGLGVFDYIICFCDSINYLTSEEDVILTLKGIYDSLKPNGIFMFDIHSTQKIEAVFKGQTYVSNEEDVSYIWNCFEGVDSYSVEHELTFFVKDQTYGTYNRFDETHFQRTFPINTYKSWLEEIGFSHITISSDFKDDLNQEYSERIFFSCQKK